MAKKEEQPELVIEGLSIENILDLDMEDVAKLSKRNLSRLAGRIQSAANKRIKRLREKGVAEYSPAVIRSLGDRVKFSIKGKTRNEILKEFKAIRRFLQAKTSSLSGFKAYKKRIESKVGEPLTNERMKEMFKIFRKYREANIGIFHRINKLANQKNYGSDQAEKFISEMLKDGKDEGEILQKLDKRLHDVYENLEEQEEQYDEEGEFGDELSDILGTIDGIRRSS